MVEFLNFNLSSYCVRVILGRVCFWLRRFFEVEVNYEIYDSLGNTFFFEGGFGWFILLFSLLLCYLDLFFYIFLGRCFFRILVDFFFKGKFRGEVSSINYNF